MIKKELKEIPVDQIMVSNGASATLNSWRNKLLKTKAKVYAYEVLNFSEFIKFRALGLVDEFSEDKWIEKIPDLKKTKPLGVSDWELKLGRVIKEEPGVGFWFLTDNTLLFVEGKHSRTETINPQYEAYSTDAVEVNNTDDGKPYVGSKAFSKHFHSWGSQFTKQLFQNPAYHKVDKTLSDILTGGVSIN